MEKNSGSGEMKWKLLLLILLCVIFPAQSASPTLLTKTIININNDNRVFQYSIDNMLLLNITSWPDGTKVTVFTLPSYNPLSQLFLWQHLGITPARYDELVEIRRQANTAAAPVVVSSESEMIDEVGHTLGGIGYVGIDTCLTSKDRVKVLTVR